MRVLRSWPGIDPGRLPILAALAAGLGFTALLGATVAVYLAVDLLGAVIMAGFLAAASGIALSGWLVHWNGLGPAPAPAARPAAPAPRTGNQDSPLHRLVEAVAAEVKASATTISGFAGLLAAQPEGDDAEVRRQLLADSEGLLAFAGGLHDYIRIERGRLRLKEQQVDAGELVASALAACRGAAEKSGTVIVGDIFDGVELTCDAERLSRAISSLVLWASGSMAEGGILDVRLARLADGGLGLEIASRGVVAELAPQERLFEPQISLTGLSGFALPIARRVALLHAGEVTAAARPGEGCAARLTLPAARVAWPDAEEQLSARAA